MHTKLGKILSLNEISRCYSQICTHQNFANVNEPKTTNFTDLGTKWQK